jgi:hypothetical protein
VQVAERKERERKREKEKREAEAARRLKEAGDAAARRRDKAAHADAVANFRTLLQVVTGPGAREEAIGQYSHLLQAVLALVTGRQVKIGKTRAGTTLCTNGHATLVPDQLLQHGCSAIS